MSIEQATITKWRQIFGNPDLPAEKLKRGRKLLDELPYESPVRVRLGNELEELQALLKSKRK